MPKPKKRKTRKRKVKAVRRKPVRRKVTRRRKAVTKRAKPRKRRRSRRPKVQVGLVPRVMHRKRKPRRSTRRKTVSGPARRRSVGKSGGNKMLIGLAIGAAAIYFLTRGSQQPRTNTNFQLPPLAQTANYNRNTQSADLVNYAVAGGLAIDAIIKLIDKLNSSSDQEVQNIYDTYHATGQGLVYV